MMNIGQVAAAISAFATLPDCLRTDIISIALNGTRIATPSTSCLIGHGRVARASSHLCSAIPTLPRLSYSLMASRKDASESSMPLWQTSLRFAHVATA